MEAKAEPNIVAVEASYRIRLPQPLCRRVGWMIGEKPLAACLLVAGPGRCRLLSAAEVDSDPDLQSLKARIAEELDERGSSMLEFQDEVSVALSLRLIQVQMTHHATAGWRLTLPRPIAAVMDLHPTKSNLAAFLVQDHIELWTIDMLRSSVTTPLTEIL